jgi:serine/threonine protein kinase
MTMLGTLLGGRYRLDAQIGRGGMSTVYRAFDTVLERPVAIKLMHREIASDSAQLERFRREARSVARLSHHHIVTVIDAGEEPTPESSMTRVKMAERSGVGGRGERGRHTSCSSTSKARRSRP